MVQCTCTGAPCSNCVPHKSPGPPTPPPAAPQPRRAMSPQSSNCCVNDTLRSPTAHPATGRSPVPTIQRPRAQLLSCHLFLCCLPPPLPPSMPPWPPLTSRRPAPGHYPAPQIPRPLWHPCRCTGPLPPPHDLAVPSRAPRPSTFQPLATGDRLSLPLLHTAYGGGFNYTPPGSVLPAPLTPPQAQLPDPLFPISVMSAPSF